jgi:hypothetical protein
MAAHPNFLDLNPQEISGLPSFRLWNSLYHDWFHTLISPYLGGGGDYLQIQRAENNGIITTISFRGGEVVFKSHYPETVIFNANTSGTLPVKLETKTDWDDAILLCLIQYWISSVLSKLILKWWGGADTQDFKAGNSQVWKMIMRYWEIPELQDTLRGVIEGKLGQWYADKDKNISKYKSVLVGNIPWLKAIYGVIQPKVKLPSTVDPDFIEELVYRASTLSQLQIEDPKGVLLNLK